MSWHLVECADPLLEGAHCLEGRLLLAAGADPDGHCLIGDTCPRCAALQAVPENKPPAVIGDAGQAKPSDSATRGPG